MDVISEYLRAQGFGPMRAHLWAQFISSVLNVLAEAEDELRRPASWAAYCKKDGAFGKVRMRGHHRGFRIPEEDGLTAELVEVAKRNMRRVGRRHLIRLLDVEIEGDPRVPDARRTGKHSKRADIRARSGCQPELEFVVEAKVLESEHHVAARLLGPDGMGCLTRRVPYTCAPVGGVLAYVVDRGRHWWVGRIAAALPARKASNVVQATVGARVPVVLSSVPRRNREPMAVVGLAMAFEPLRGSRQ